METSKSAGRRFTIADGMILIAATAAGLSWSGGAWPTLESIMDNPPASWENALEWTMLLITVTLPCLVAWTVAVLILRLRRPRPSWRQIARQPGMMACLAVTLGLLILMPFIIGSFWHRLVTRGRADLLSTELPARLLEIFSMVSPMLGFVVMIAWVLLLIQRRWWCEQGWIDRAGQLLGSTWVVAGSILGAYWLKELIGIL